MTRNSSFFFVAFLHLVVSVIYKEYFGINVDNYDSVELWDMFWQNIPFDLLDKRFFESLWYMHSQPPMYNFIGGVLIKWFAPYHLEVLHYLQIICGAISSGLIYLILLRLTKIWMLSLLAAVVITFNPSTFLFESFIVYDLFTSFFIIVCVFGLIEYEHKKTVKYLFLFVASFTLLLSLRSLYQVALLPIVILAVCILGRPHWKKILIYSSLFSIIPLGVCFKNYVYYQKFSSSSWGGLVLWKNAKKSYPESELQRLCKEGVVEEAAIVSMKKFKPSRLAGYGFDRESSIPVLSRDDYHNINIIHISEMYKKNAIRLIRHDPCHYMVKLYNNYKYYCRPSADYFNYGRRKERFERMHAHITFYSKVLQGQGFMGEYASTLFFIMPVFIILYLIYPFILSKKDFCCSIRFFGEDYAMAVILLFVLYTAFLVCGVSDAEYQRYKFVTEQLLWAFFVVVGCRYFFLLPGMSRQR